MARLKSWDTPGSHTEVLELVGGVVLVLLPLLNQSCPGDDALRAEPLNAAIS